MMYLVVMSQEGQGCDYTIGCGMSFEDIEGSSLAEVIEKVLWPDGREERSALEGDNALDTLLIIERQYVTTIDLNEKRVELEQIRKQQKREELRIKELAELKRLQEKYGDR